MEYDEKTQQYRPSASDIISDDIIAWLENCPVSTFENPWFQVKPNVKTVLKRAREDNIKEPTVWDILRSLRLELEPNPSEEAIREFAAAEERNELSKEHIADVSVIHYLKHIKFETLLSAINSTFIAHDGEIDVEQLSMTAWDSLRWLMADRLNNSRFESEATPHEHLASPRMQ